MTARTEEQSLLARFRGDQVVTGWAEIAKLTGMDANKMRGIKSCKLTSSKGRKSRPPEGSGSAMTFPSSWRVLD